MRTHYPICTSRCVGGELVSPRTRQGTMLPMAAGPSVPDAQWRSLTAAHTPRRAWHAGPPAPSALVTAPSAWRPRSPPGMHTQDLTYSWHVAVMLLSVRCSHGRAVLPARPTCASAAPLRARAPPSHAVARGGGGTNKNEEGWSLTESRSSTSDSVREASRGANLGGFARRRNETRRCPCSLCDRRCRSLASLGLAAPTLGGAA